MRSRYLNTVVVNHALRKAGCVSSVRQNTLDDPHIASSVISRLWSFKDLAFPLVVRPGLNTRGTYASQSQASLTTFEQQNSVREYYWANIVLSSGHDPGLMTNRQVEMCPFVLWLGCTDARRFNSGV